MNDAGRLNEPPAVVVMLAPGVTVVGGVASVTDRMRTGAAIVPLFVSDIAVACDSMCVLATYTVSPAAAAAIAVASVVAAVAHESYGAVLDPVCLT